MVHVRFSLSYYLGFAIVLYRCVRIPRCLFVYLYYVIL